MLPLFRGLVVASIVGLWPALAAAAPLSAEDLVRAALARQPEAVRAEAAVEAAEAGRRAVAVFLDNPSAQLGVGLLEGQLEASLVQPISLSGEGWQARREARAVVDAATAEARRSAFSVAAEARGLYAAAVAAEERLRVAVEALEQARRLRASFEARSATGEASGLDVRLARLTEADAAATALSARAERTDARIALASLVDGGATADLPTDPLSAVPSGGAAYARSDLAAAESRALAAEAALARARAAAVPRLGVGVFAERDDAASRTDAGPLVTLSIPLWTFGQGDVGDARADLSGQIARRDLLTARIAAEQAETASAADWADEAVAHLADAGTDARGALEAIEAGWTSGEIGLAEAVLLRREVLDGWIAAIDAREQAARMRLDALLAAEDPSLLPAGVTP